jgi:hypothetical protein
VRERREAGNALTRTRGDVAAFDWSIMIAVARKFKKKKTKITNVILIPTINTPTRWSLFHTTPFHLKPHSASIEISVGKLLDSKIEKMM